MSESINFSVEYTDTYSGVANYSWVNREKITFPKDSNPTDRQIMRKAKKVMGLSGVRGKSFHYGDFSEFRPYRSCTILFVSFDY